MVTLPEISTKILRELFETARFPDDLSDDQSVRVAGRGKTDATRSLQDLRNPRAERHKEHRIEQP